LLFRVEGFHLRMGRAYALQGGLSGFPYAWKDADPDIPILTAAKAEYAKLK
jgi:hypothetical protein